MRLPCGGAEPAGRAESSPRGGCGRGAPGCEECGPSLAGREGWRRPGGRAAGAGVAPGSGMGSPTVPGQPPGLLPLSAAAVRAFRWRRAAARGPAVSALLPLSPPAGPGSPAWPQREDPRTGPGPLEERGRRVWRWARPQPHCRRERAGVGGGLARPFPPSRSPVCAQCPGAVPRCPQSAPFEQWGEPRERLRRG